MLGIHYCSPREIGIFSVLFISSLIIPVLVVGESKHWEKNVGGVSIALQQCRIEDKNVKCILEFTNNDKDKILSIGVGGWGTSKAFDDSGNEYLSTLVRVANKTTTGRANSNTLIFGIKTKGEIVFGNISPHANMIARLDIGGTLGNDTFLLTFRDIPLKR